MACGTVSGGEVRLRMALACSSESWLTLLLRRSIKYMNLTPISRANLRSRLRRSPSVLSRLRCNAHYSGNPSPTDQSPPQEAVLKAISEVSKMEGRVAQTRNVVMGGTITGESEDEWKVLDQKVNSYPTVRGFTAIGTGGNDFVQAMVGAVESVLQIPIPEGRVTHKLSSRGKYVSVNIGPVTVVSSDQVQAVYNAMRRDVRMKYFL